MQINKKPIGKYTKADIKYLRENKAAFVDRMIELSRHAYKMEERPFTSDSLIIARQSSLSVYRMVLRMHKGK